MASQHATSAPPLTPKAIEAARPRERDYELPDAGAPGLRLRVSPKGAKIFRWYVNGARPRRVITIGRWSKVPQPGRVTLAEARVWLEKLKAGHRAGRLDVVEAELAAVRPARRGSDRGDAGSPTLEAVGRDFIAHIERRRKRPDEVRRSLERDVFPVLGERAITEITPRDVRSVVEAVVARGSPTQAGRTLAHLKQLFRFACGRDDVAVAANPAYPLDADALGVVNNVCQRFLSPEEITAFWHALDASGMTPTVRLGLRLVLLTGVRSCELLRARWDEVDLESATWTIPVANQKLTRKQEQKARPWVVPLAPSVVELLRHLLVLAEKAPWVMASPHERGEPLTEKALNAAMRKLFEAPKGKAPLLAFTGERPTPHDLRRTMRTYLGDRLGVAWHIAERCLNHSISKITSVYDVGDYLDERRAALEKWASYVERLASPVDAKVAFIDRRRS